MLVKEVRKLIQHSSPYIMEEDGFDVGAVLRSGLVASGIKVRDFEREVTTYLGTAGSIALSSGSAALILALKSLEIGEGDEVILPTYVCISVANAVRSVGAIPILSDIGDDWNMTPESVEKCISKKTKAIIVVHIFGISAGAEAFSCFGLPLIEDCCQAFGGESPDKITGTMGAIGIFSFQATKCLTTGEGGMATTRDIGLLARMKELRATNAVPAPMSDIQAALGLNQIRNYEYMLGRRRQIAQRYFKELPAEWTYSLSEVSHKSMFFRFPLIVKGDFESIRCFCADNGFAVRKGVDSLLHRSMDLLDQHFPNAVKMFNSTVSIPIYPALTDEEQSMVIKGLNKYERF